MSTILSDLTYRQMADIISSIRAEVQERNPIGVNFYTPIIHEAANALREISAGEILNPTSECGPKEV